MKTIFISTIVLLLFSCSKDDCEKCTQTWKYTTYINTGNHTNSNYSYYDGVTETFYACGEDAIDAAEKGATTYSKTPIPNSNKWSIVEGAGTCDCQ